MDFLLGETYGPYRRENLPRRDPAASATRDTPYARLRRIAPTLVLMACRCSFAMVTGIDHSLLCAPRSAKGRPCRTAQSLIFQQLLLLPRRLPVLRQGIGRCIHLRVSQKELNCAQVAGLLVNLDDLCPAHRVGAVCCHFQTDGRNPIPHDPRVLTC